MAEIASAFVSLMPSARGFGRKVESEVGGETKAAGSKLGKGFGMAFAASGAIAGAAIAGGLLKAIDNERLNDKLAAQMGLTASQSKKIGGVAGKLYADAYGGSLEEVNTAVGAVMSSIDGMSKASGKRLESVTAKALDFATAFDTDVSRAAQVAGQLVENGLAKNAGRAFDLLVASSQRVPAAVREDLLDATDEYGQFFSTLGYSGEQTFGLLVDAADKGAIGIDKAADAIKEFTIRATDGSETTNTALENIGLNAVKMSDDILAGGSKAQGATQKIIKGLLKIESPSERAQTALALFGTPLEDLSVRDIPKFLKSLQGGEDGLGKLGGAATRMGDTLNDNAATKIESFKRTVTTKFVNFLGGTVLPALEGFVDGIGPSLDRARELADALKGVAKVSFGKLGEGVEALKGLGDLDLGNIDGAKLGKQVSDALRDGLGQLGSLAGDLSKMLGKTFAKVDWVGLGITIGKFVPALLAGLAAGILTFDLGALLGGLADHWRTILLGVLTLMFAPVKFIAPLTKMLAKIPFVGRFLAAAVKWINDIGGKMLKFGGDLLKQFWRGLTGGRFPGGQFIAKVLAAIKGLPGKVGDFFKLLQTRIGVWALNAFEAMGKGTRTAVGTALRFIGGIPGMILRALGSLAKTLSPRGYELIAGLLQAAKTRFVSVVTYIGGIPGRLLGALGDLGSLFYNKGVELIAGLARGISAKMTEAINAVKSGLDRIKGLLPGSPIKWGPLKNWNKGGAGKRLMALVAKGITEATPKTVKAAQSAFDKIADKLTATRDNLKGTLDGLKGDFASLSDSVAKAFTGNLFDVVATEAQAATSAWSTATGEMGATVGQNFLANLTAKKAELTGLLASFKTLQGWGIPSSFLSQLFASGNGALITELAGMGQAGATSAASLFGEVTDLGNQLGNAVASNDPVADRIDETNRLLGIAVTQLEFLDKNIGKQLNGAASKARRNKKNGGKK